MDMIFLTNAYPFGQPDNWKTIELEEFVKWFDKITLVPFSDQRSTGENIPLPGRVFVEDPLYKAPSFFTVLGIISRTLFSRLLPYFLKEFLLARVFLSRSRLISWLRSSFYTARLYLHPTIQQLLRQQMPGRVWYFYWGNQSALLIPLIHERTGCIACRFHGADLYIERNNGYLPYQEQILKYSSMILPCSNHGLRYLQQRFPHQASKLWLARLGVVIPSGQISFEKLDTLKIVTCSYVTPVKRLVLLAAALQHINIPISWTHVGNGEGLTALQQLCRRLPGRHRVEFTGYMKHEAIIDFYLRENFQLFVNVSSFEGVPVSIMEAMSIGIPIIATAVGGTGELVDDSVGRLLPSDIDERALASAIEQFATLDIDVRKQMSRNAMERIKEFSDGKQRAQLLMAKLVDCIRPCEMPD